METVDNVANSGININENEAHTPQKGSKRKFQDVDNIPNRSIPGYSNDAQQIPSTSSTDPETPRSSKKYKDIDPSELHNILEGMEEEIDDALEKAASKNKLTRTNVKNILRHVITNEYVLAMVRNTMKIENGEKDLEEAVFEPKLTRSKAKELRKNQFTISWPVSTPIKKGDPVTQQLLEKEFPEESSDDEDYKPNEEEEQSDDDDARSPRTSELWSPRTPLIESSPLPAVGVEPEYFDEENGLVIELPDLTPLSDTSEADKIALRTRSKLPLNDTPLEEIEASFFAPDFTVDMYDTFCDDEEWLKFLSDLGKPIDNTTNIELTSEVDDPEDDPEYNIQEEEEEEDTPDPLDIAFDHTTKVPRAELNALMAEIQEFAEREFMDVEDEEDDENKLLNQTYGSVFTTPSSTCGESKTDEWMTADDKVQLDEQMRMYVQLLTQAYLLSHGSEDLKYINISTKLFLDELKMCASRKMRGNKKSTFCAHNLDNALKIINKFEKLSNASGPQTTEPLKHCPVPVTAKRTIANSKVFIYPDLLPTCGFPPHFNCKKAVFTSAEDNLIAIGLEQFSNHDNKIEKIRQLLVPTKSESQIKIRIKNCCATKTPLDNPIKFYHVHKVAPVYPRVVRIFDPENVKIPAEYPMDSLPKWMTYYCHVANGNPMFVPPPIAPSQPIAPVAPPVAIVRPMFRKVPEKRKSRPLLPQCILKKYTFPKKTVPILPFSVTSPLKAKCGHISNSPCLECLPMQKGNLVSRPRAIMPKPVPTSESPNEQFISVSPNISVISDSSLLQPLNIVSVNPEAPFSTAAQTVQILVNPVTTTSVSNLEILSDTQVNNTSFLNPSNLNLTQPPPTPDNFITPDLETVAEISPIVSSSSKISPAENNGTNASSNAADIDIDEAVEEDEPDIATVAIATVKKQTMSKKKNRIHRDLESSLALLEPSMMSKDPKKEEREILYANSYLLRAAESLKNEPDTWNLFLTTVCKYQHCTRYPVKLYLELKEILKNHPALLEDFVAFLKPAEAKLVGKYKQYLMLEKIRLFLRKVEVHFSNQPHHIPRLVRVLSQFQKQSYVTSSEALSGLLPLLRNQTHLVEELTQLIPDAAPPVYLLTDFEDFAFPNSDEDVSSGDEIFENITIPDTPDPYGGKECPCNCHSNSTDSKMLNRSRHCAKCGVKFIDGRIYLQTGKVLKPAQVTYHELPPDSRDKGKHFQKAAQKLPLPHEVILKALSEANVATKQVPSAPKKDTSKATSNNSKPSTLSSNEPLPSTSKLPCDIIEDTVFPTTVNASSKSTPSDFSHLRDMITQSQETSTMIQREYDKKHATPQKKKWSSEEDKLIIYNCQRLGISKETFLLTGKTLGRNADEVEDRLFSLVEISSPEPKQQA